MIFFSQTSLGLVAFCFDTFGDAAASSLDDFLPCFPRGMVDAISTLAGTRSDYEQSELKCIIVLAIRRIRFLLPCSVVLLMIN